MTPEEHREREEEREVAGEVSVSEGCARPGEAEESWATGAVSGRHEEAGEASVSRGRASSGEAEENRAVDAMREGHEEAGEAPASEGKPPSGEAEGDRAAGVVPRGRGVVEEASDGWPLSGGGEGKGDRVSAAVRAGHDVARETSDGTPRSDETGRERPADAARRALRAARERAGQEAIGTPGEGEAVAREGRPGDAARAALRGTATPAGSPEAETRAADVSGPEVPEAPQARTGTGSHKSGRPGDVAREALRAAREEARRARFEAEAVAAETTRPPVRPTPGLTARERRPADSGRDVRELLAHSFELPPDQSLTDPARSPEPWDDDSRPDPSPPVTVGDVLRAVAAPVSRPGTVGGESPWAASPGGAGDTSTTPGTSGTAKPPGTPKAPGTANVGGLHGTRETHGTRDIARSRQAAPPDENHPSHPSHPAPPGISRLASSSSSMAAPGRDGELRRTFPALPASGSRTGAARLAGFAESWWGNAWVAALEEGALDAARLGRGRGYAQKGHVDAITVTPGLVLAYVQGSRPRPYRVQVRLRTLGDQEWERFLDAAVERPGHIAALLDKEMPHSLADCGAPLLPLPGDLEPRCSCPDSGHPCKHAAALCYQTARLLDADPFVLLLLRGRGEREVLDELSRRNAARAARAVQEQQPASFPGVRASDALVPRRLPSLPAPLPPRPHPEPPPAYPASPGGPDPFALDQLATDAAARAHTLLTSGHDPVGELTLWQDAVRLAAARPGSGLTAGTRSLYSSLARAAGRTPADLSRAVAAWRQGGLDGLAVLEEVWDPPAGRFDRARPLLLAADLPAFRPRRNHLTHPRGHIQLRLGRDGLWYAYESEPGHDDWWPRGTPDLDPVGALTGLGNPTEH
ncbi:SWIM zinc finger family protein [Streptomyces sp. AK08-02]|uniref:SWIM zinc finger family protein n=1 Tax=Streptomyces sp. AK08-02 TaxID=3028654 RepID=UPI0029A4F996|nr:SWIM zinc finger family protein [Streptomyces sp. AK08-02]MDX3746561.1 SWIM zinc finger family protein [Streptomyces sp. AK08-02]